MCKYRTLLLLLCASMVTACNFSLIAPPKQQPASTLSLPTSTSTPAFPPSLTFTPPPMISATPGEPQLTPNTTAVNCRSGPDVAYASVDTINLSQIALIAGKDENKTWWYVRDPNNKTQFCWVAASVVTTSGNLNNLPVIPLTDVIVTKVTVGASVSFSMCSGPNPVTFSGTITANGPAKVSFQWEIRGDKSNTTSPQTLTFKTAGTKNAPSPGSYSADCGHYSISLHVLSPNDISAKQDFKIGP